MKRKSQSGFLMIIAVAIILIIGFIGVAATYFFTGTTLSSSDELKSNQALYAAQAALEHGTHKLLGPTIANRVPCSGMSITNNAFGAGAYSVAGTGPIFATASTLSVALSASDTTVTVTPNVTSYDANGGRLMIDHEMISYTDASGTTFTGVVRGIDGTTATSHVVSTPVSQYECNLSTTGAISSLTAPTNPGDSYGKRTLTESVQEQQIWTVGNAAGGQFKIYTWNPSTAETTWVDQSQTNASSSNQNAISMNSYADGWSVGAARRFLHWNGSTWTLTSVTPNVAYNGVYCNAWNDCWAVGNANGGAVTIQQYTGAAPAWNRFAVAGSPNQALQSVNCSASNDCWTVGNARTFLHWNGTTWTVTAVGVGGFTSATNPPVVNYNGVFCNSSTDCWAVGAASGGNVVIAQWNGTNWTQVTPTGAAVNSPLDAVTCSSSDACWTVGGNSGGNALIYQWNGTNWSRFTVSPVVNKNLFAVACATDNDCWTAGATSTVLHWDGSAWTQSAISFASITLNGIAVVHPNSKPQAVWRETFP